MDTKRARDNLKEYWDAHSEKPTIEAMMLNDEARNIDNQDRNDVLSTLPDWTGADIVEIGAGIGRYTGDLLERSNSVHVTDFIDSFVEENKRLYGHHKHATFEVSDATHLTRKHNSCDFVFTNWLLMYLTDHETVQFLLKCLDWLRPNGVIHIRESCSQPSTGTKRDNNPTHYRHVSQYLQLLDTIITNQDGKTFGFKVLWTKSINAYIDEYGNWRQAHMVVRKVQLKDTEMIPINDLAFILADSSVNLQLECDAKWAATKKLLGQARSPIQDYIQPVIDYDASHVLIVNSKPITSIDPFSVALVGNGCQVNSIELDAYVYSRCLNAGNEMKNRAVKFGWSPSLSELHTNPLTESKADLVIGVEVLENQSNNRQIIESIKKCMNPKGKIQLLESNMPDIGTLKQVLVNAGFEHIIIENVTEKVLTTINHSLKTTQITNSLDELDLPLVKKWSQFYNSRKSWYNVWATRM